MRTYSKTLTAGETVNLPVNGTFFVLLSAAAAVRVSFTLNGTSGNFDNATIPPGYWEKFPYELRTMEITSDVDQDITYGCSWGEAGITQSETVIRQASTLNNLDTATVGTVSDVCKPANASHKRSVFTAGPDNSGLIYLGGPDVSTGNAAIILAAGETWEETGAAAAAWYAVADSADQLLRIMTAE